MTRPRSMLSLVALGGAGALVAAIIDPTGPWPGLVALGAGVAIGELFELRPQGGAAIPLSFAMIVVLLRAATVSQFVIVVVAAEVVALVVREAPAWRLRPVLLLERLLSAGAAFAAVAIVDNPTVGQDARLRVLLALGIGAAAMLATTEVLRLARDRRYAFSVHGRSAEFALITSGILMSIGYDGIGGKGGMGLWGPVLFSLPLAAAWYSFEQLASIRRTYDQTIGALSVTPELGGLVPKGHTKRVTVLSLEMGREFDFNKGELAGLETAALVHHLGQLTLDEPEDPARGVDWAEVAQAGATMLRASESLAPAGEVLAASERPARAELGTALDPVPPITALSGQILKVASAFDELSEGRADNAPIALEMLYSGPAYVYDGRVLAALETVLHRRKVLPVDA
jgi:hypothetical protein